MARGNKIGKSRTEYEKFKKNEPGYIESLLHKDTKKRKKDWIWWLVALAVVSTSTYFLVDRMVESREELTQVSKIDKLSAEEAVHQLYDEEGKWIRKDLRQAEYDLVKQKVEDLNDSAEKAKIRSLLATAGEQLESQLKGLALVNGLKTKSGDINVDLKEKDLVTDLKDFPKNYNPEYVEELKSEYQKIAKVIEKAIDLQTRVRELTVGMDKGLDKTELDSLNKQVEGLPYSDRKMQLTNDMKALYQEYNKQQEELKKQLAEEKRQREIEEERRRQEEEIRKVEQERQAEIERQEQERLEWKREQERIEAEEQKRIEESYNNTHNNTTTYPDSTTGESTPTDSSSDSATSESTPDTSVDSTEQPEETKPEDTTVNDQADDSQSGQSADSSQSAQSVEGE